jgi:broad specificity phosphatase PhoE
MKSQTIWIARHGNRFDFVEPEWFNTALRRYDPPLSKDGLIQAQQLAHRLKHETIEHIFVSPFLRAIQTAYPIAKNLNLPLKIEQGLSEWLNQDWMTEMPETEPQEDLAQNYPLIDWSYQSLVIPSYPETEIAMMKRTNKTIQALIRNYAENILLVGHKVSVMGCASGLLSANITINAPLGCLVKIVQDHDQWVLKLNGDTSHLIVK